MHRHVRTAHHRFRAAPAPRPGGGRRRHRPAAPRHARHGPAPQQRRKQVHHQVRLLAHPQPGPAARSLPRHALPVPLPRAAGSAGLAPAPARPANGAWPDPPRPAALAGPRHRPRRPRCVRGPGAGKLLHGGPGPCGGGTDPADQLQPAAGDGLFRTAGRARSSTPNIRARHIAAMRAPRRKSGWRNWRQALPPPTRHWNGSACRRRDGRRSAHSSSRQTHATSAGATARGGPDRDSQYSRRDMQTAAGIGDGLFRGRAAAWGPSWRRPSAARPPATG